MPIASAFRLDGVAVQSKRFWGDPALARACRENRTRLHDAEVRPNLHFLVFPVQSDPEPKKTRFPSYFTSENGGVAGAGIEPATRGFSVHCSAN